MMPGDPYVAPPWPCPLAEEVGADPGRLRVGFVTAHPSGAVPEDAELTGAVTAAASLLEALGHDVTPDHPEALGDPAFGRHYGTLVAANVAAELEAIAAWRGRPVGLDELEPRNRLIAGRGRDMRVTDYLAAVAWLHGYGRRMAAWWAGGFDLLVTPTLGVAPFRLGWISDHTDAGLPVEMERTSLVLPFTAPFNATGQPAISLPLHRTAGGLPVGVQIVAAAGREDLLVRIAAQIEAARPFEHAAMTR
jgi:amidase